MRLQNVYGGSLDRPRGPAIKKAPHGGHWANDVTRRQDPSHSMRDLVLDFVGEADWRIEYASVISAFGVPSEVLIATRS